MAKQRFEIKKVPSSDKTSKYQLLDEGYVYSAYETEEEAENAAASILVDEKREIIQAARHLEDLLDGSKLTAGDLPEELSRFIQRYQ